LNDLRKKVKRRRSKAQVERCQMRSLRGQVI